MIQKKSLNLYYLKSLIIIYMLIILGNYVALIEGKKNNFCILLINFIFSLIKIIINI